MNGNSKVDHEAAKDVKTLNSDKFNHVEAAKDAKIWDDNSENSENNDNADIENVENNENNENNENEINIEAYIEAAKDSKTLNGYGQIEAAKDAKTLKSANIN